MIILSGQSLPALSNPGAAGDLKNGKQLIDANGNVLTGTMPNITLPSPGITVSTGGLITASYSQDAGYSAGGSKSATKQLTTQAGTTITPGTSQKTAVASGRYTTGNVYVAGDSDLVASNIKSGVNIFGVTGNYTGGDLSIQVYGMDYGSGTPYPQTNEISSRGSFSSGYSLSIRAPSGLSFNDEIKAISGTIMLDGYMDSYLAEFGCVTSSEQAGFSYNGSAYSNSEVMNTGSWIYIEIPQGVIDDAQSHGHWGGTQPSVFVFCCLFISQ